MKNVPKFIVHGQSYQSTFDLTGPEFCFFQRDHQWPQPAIQIDATGFFWILGMIDCQENSLSYLRGQEEVRLTGKQLIFFGTHSIVRWSIPACHLQWQGLISPLRPPLFLDNEVWALEVAIFPTFDHPRQVFNFFCEHQGEMVPIGAREHDSGIGQRIKVKIDQSYYHRNADSLIGRQLALPEALITRYFKSCYGITPVEYRNRKRIYDAVGLIMMTSMSMKEIAATLGFGEISRFNRNFAKYLDCCPSDFCHPYRKRFTKAAPISLLADQL